MADASSDEFDVLNTSQLEVTDTGGYGTRTLGIKSGGVGTTELGALSVTTAKIAADAVTNAKIADAAVSLEHLDSGIAPSHIVKYAGLSASETDSDASVVISVPGVVAGDTVLATIKAQAGTASILKAVPTTDTITVTLSGNGGAGTIIQYMVLRAAA